MNAHKKEIVIDAAKFESRRIAHEYMREVLNRDTYIGNSLDALHDSLSTMYEPTIIKLLNLSEGKKLLGAYMDRLIRVFEYIELENDFLSFVVETESGVEVPLLPPLKEV